jgi:hypothetical protein
MAGTPDHVLVTEVLNSPTGLAKLMLATTRPLALPGARIRIVERSRDAPQSERRKLIRSC